jgi:flagellar biosynthetic protein FliR
MQEIVSALGQPWITAVVLLSARIAALLLFTPVLYAAPMPALARMLVSVALACVIAMPFAGASNVSIQDLRALVAALLGEAAIGATLGLGVLMAFAGFTFAGRVLDLQMGFGLAQVLDPVTRGRVPVLSSAFGALAAVFFFVVNGHHALLRGIAYSVERWPPGQGWRPEAAAQPLVQQMGSLFALGFGLAAPVVLMLLLVEFALGVISRNLPQMNMLVLGIPIKIVVGLLALSVWAGGFAAPAERLYAQIYRTWTAWMAAGGSR